MFDLLVGLAVVAMVVLWRVLFRRPLPEPLVGLLISVLVVEGIMLVVGNAGGRQIPVPATYFPGMASLPSKA